MLITGKEIISVLLNSIFRFYDCMLKRLILDRLFRFVGSILSEFVYSRTRSYLNSTHPRDYFELGHLKRFIYADQYICLWFTPETDFSVPILTSTTVNYFNYRTQNFRYSFGFWPSHQINLYLEKAYSLRLALSESRSTDVKTLGVLFPDDNSTAVSIHTALHYALYLANPC